MEERTVIDLATFRTSPEARSFSGRPRGEFCRQELRLSARESGGEKFKILIPPDTYALNMSFFLGMFGPSVRRFKKSGFAERFEFSGSPHILKVLPKYMDEALLDSMALPETKTA